LPFSYKKQLAGFTIIPLENRKQFYIMASIANNQLTLKSVTNIKKIEFFVGGGQKAGIRLP
jgi:hypothetical protein